MAIAVNSLRPGDLFELATGVAVLVISICGLAGIAPPILAASAALVLGASLFASGRNILSDYARLSPFCGVNATWKDGFGVNNGTAVFLAGLFGAMLGLLSICDVNPGFLTPAATIAFGVGFVLKSNASWQIHFLSRTQKAPTPKGARDENVADMAIIEAIAGLAAAILGSLAVAGNPNDLVLTLVSLLVLASTIIFETNSVTDAILRLSHPLWLP